MDYSSPATRRTCLGLVSGFLHKCENNKGRISLDSRYCMILKLFSPFDTTISLPMVLGAEDKLVFRINQFNLGAPVKWYRELCNMRGVTIEKIERINRYTEGWNDNELSRDMYEACYNFALYEDQEEQKDLYI